MTEITIAEFMAGMQEAFLPEKASGLDVAIQIKLTGAETSEWAISIKDKTCSIQQASVEGARLTITMDSGDFIKLFTGKLDAMQAYMQGKIRVAGDINIALKLMNLFKFQSFPG